MFMGPVEPQGTVVMWHVLNLGELQGTLTAPKIIILLQDVFLLD